MLLLLLLVHCLDPGLLGRFLVFFNIPHLKCVWWWGELRDDYTQEDSVIDLPCSSSMHWEYIKIFFQFFLFSLNFSDDDGREGNLLLLLLLLKQTN